jgi:hypothetical protein
MTTLEVIRAEIERLKADPPRMDESPSETGCKLLEIADVLLLLADEVMKANKRSAFPK